MEKDEIIELLESLRLPEEPQVRKVAGFYEGQAITNEWASQVDWVKETDNFDLNTINEIVENIGKSGREKKIVIKAIYDAMLKTGEVSKIPYGVDKLLNNLYKKYDENGIGLLPSITTNELNPDLISLFKKKMDEFITDKQNNNEFSSDNSGTFLQQIEDLKAQVENLKKENASLKEQAEEKTKKAEELDKKRVEEIDNWHSLYESALMETSVIDGTGEIAFKGASNKCFTKAQMCLLIYTVASIKDGPIPVKKKLVPIITAISGYEETSVDSEIRKGGFRKKDIETVARIFEEAMPNLAAEIRKQVERKPTPKK